jgi:mRNA interferase MazF
VEQRGRRPALIVQNNTGNRFSRATVVAAISSAPVEKVYPFVVMLPEGEGGLPRAGHVNCSQLLTIDKSRLIEKIGALSSSKMVEVDRALLYELGLQQP